MELYNKLNEKEITMMDRYISDYATYTHAGMTTILKYWDKNKSDYLYKLLGNQFMISKDFEYSKGYSTLFDELSKVLNNRLSATARFIRQFDRFLWENRVALGSNYFRLQELTSSKVLLASKYDGADFEVFTPDGKSVKVQKGCRPLRMIARIVKAYGNIETLDAFQTEISQILNQRKLKGQITLSIHPLDYMTMSDNESGWSSCMSWREEGCYRRGTVEMMNSDCVLVAYLRGEHDMRMPGGYEWNNKKWRELFIVTPEIITGVKGYPYQNEDLVKCINEWIRDLAVQNLGWDQFKDQKNTQYEHRNNFHMEDGREMYVEFETGTMYNDFGSIVHYGIFSNSESLHEIYQDYSGPEMCLACGGTNEYFESEGELVCEHCNGDYITCDNCGDRIHEGEDYELDGGYYCYDCYCDLAVEDGLTGSMHHQDNMRTLYLISDEKAKDLDKVDWYEEEAIDTYFGHLRSEYYHGSTYFFDDLGKYRKDAIYSSSIYYYVTPSMMRNPENDCQTYFHISLDELK